MKAVTEFTPDVTPGVSGVPVHMTDKKLSHADRNAGSAAGRSD